MVYQESLGFISNIRVNDVPTFYDLYKYNRSTIAYLRLIRPAYFVLGKLYTYASIHFIYGKNKHIIVYTITWIL